MVTSVLLHIQPKLMFGQSQLTSLDESSYLLVRGTLATAETSTRESGGVARYAIRDGQRSPLPCHRPVTWNDTDSASYMAVSIGEVNAITFQQKAFRIIHESKTVLY